MILRLRGAHNNRWLLYICVRSLTYVNFSPRLSTIGEPEGTGEDANELRCPNCHIRLPSKASLKNHINVCKSRNGGATAVNSTANPDNVSSNATEDVRKSLKILEQSCFPELSASEAQQHPSKVGVIETYRLIYYVHTNFLLIGMGKGSQSNSNARQ